MMSQARFNRIDSGLTSTARKVYSAVPLVTPWDAPQIVAELKRGGITHNFAIIVGCLNSLISAGLVRETSKGMFVREPVKPAVEAKETKGAEVEERAHVHILTPVPTPARAPVRSIAPPPVTPSPLPYQEALALMKPSTPPPPAKPTTPTEPASALDKLGALAVRINALGASLNETLREIGSEMADLAVEIETERELKDADLVKLKQLQSLLKSIGG